ncbi:hypothetical protein [Egbenema bharatensis]|uniref:hypothetical protein n=1 Tax=Egbenema bharatensis TaxID=3463334 RepID=UPI003A84A6CC
MIWSTVRTNTENFSHLEPIAHLSNAAKWLWRFSNFYGEYTSLPPQDRRRMVNERITESRRQRISRY